MVPSRRNTGRRVGLDASTRIATDADLSTDSAAVSVQPNKAPEAPTSNPISLIGFAVKRPLLIARVRRSWAVKRTPHLDTNDRYRADSAFRAGSLYGHFPPNCDVDRPGERCPVH